MDIGPKPPDPPTSVLLATASYVFENPTSWPLLMIFDLVIAAWVMVKVIVKGVPALAIPAFVVVMLRGA